MNLDLLKMSLSQMKEIRPIGRTADIGGCTCHVMGFVLHTDGSLRLLLLTYDPDLQEHAEPEAFQGSSPAAAPETNRTQLRGGQTPAPHLSFCGPVECVSIGGQSFTTDQSESALCGNAPWESAVLFTRFLLAGWEPAGIDTRNLDYVSLTTLNLDGSYRVIPEVDPSVPFRFAMRMGSRRRLVEYPIALTVGEDYPARLEFPGQSTGAPLWVQINRVYLCDVWAEMERLFSDPRMREYASEEVLAQEKRRFEASFAPSCPRGMCFPVIEYECEEGLSFQFYSSRWLSASPSPSDPCTGILMRPDRSAGRLGLPLKASVIQEPVSRDTALVEAELFCCYDRGEDILI